MKMKKLLTFLKEVMDSIGFLCHEGNEVKSKLILVLNNWEEDDSNYFQALNSIF